MDYLKIPNTDLSVSRIGLGTWAMGDDFFGHVIDEESVRTIQAALDAGINLIDTAPVYGSGHSEEVVGKAIKGRRQEVVLATKCGNKRTATGFERDFSPEYLTEEIENQLRRLGTETIDLYFIHWPDPHRPLEPGIEALQQLQTSGKFRYLALSNFSIELIEQVRALMPVVCLQPHYSLLKREIEGAILPYAREHDMGMTTYGTLAGGILTGKFKTIPAFEEGDNRAKFYSFFKEPTWSRVAELVEVLREVADAHICPPGHVAINWCLKNPVVSSVLVGAKSPQQARDNAAARAWELSDEEYQRITGAQERIFKDNEQ